MKSMGVMGWCGVIIGSLASLVACGAPRQEEDGAQRGDTSTSVSEALVPDRQKGIYVLDSFAGTYRDGNIREHEFVDGYAWRYPWSQMESGTTPGSYDFTALDHIIARLSLSGLKLSMIIMPGEPAYITTSGGAQTWTHGTVVKPRPWDQYTVDRYGAFLQALSTHPVPDPAYGGAPVPLKDHSLFYALNITLPGAPNGGIRDKDVSIVDIPAYTRELFIENAVLQNLGNARSAFPARHLSVGFWSNIENDGLSTPLWQAIRDRILDEFDGVNQSSVGVFMDNLAAKRSCVGCSPYVGSPTVEYASSLFTMQGATFTAFQALTSWKTPSTRPVGPNETQADRVRYGTPMDGIEHAVQNFDTRYFELYVDDVDNPEWQAGLSDWAATLRSSP